MKRDVPERCERAKDILHNTVSDDVSFLWSRLVDLKFVVQEAEYVLQEEEFWPIELHVREHVAHQGIPAIWPRVRARTTRILPVSRGLPRVIWLLSTTGVRVRLLGDTKRPGLTGCLFAMLKP